MDCLVCGDHRIRSRSLGGQACCVDMSEARPSRLACRPDSFVYKRHPANGEQMQRTEPHHHEKMEHCRRSFRGSLSLALRYSDSLIRNYGQDSRIPIRLRGRDRLHEETTAVRIAGHVVSQASSVILTYADRRCIPATCM